MLTSSTDSDKIQVKSNENDVFEMDKRIVRHSKTLHEMLKNANVNVADNQSEEQTPLVDTDSVTLKRVIEWFSKHVDDPKKYDWEVDEGAEAETVHRGYGYGDEDEDETEEEEEDEMAKWDKEFIKRMNPYELYQLIMAADYLCASGLINLGCKTVAGWMRGKSVEEVRELFHIENDFTKEEEDAIRKENAWAEENSSTK